MKLASLNGDKVEKRQDPDAKLRAARIREGYLKNQIGWAHGALQSAHKALTTGRADLAAKIVLEGMTVIEIGNAKIEAEEREERNA